MKIEEKDWKRMSDLVLSQKDGSPSVIKNKNKAIARFIAGIKLDNANLKFNDSWGEYSGMFSEFGNRALELGATPEEIQLVYNENQVPKKYSELLAQMSNKKLNNRFVGDISKKILDAGYDVNFIHTNGNAITEEGKEAMERNGRKWTIGYKMNITKGDKITKLVFDAITDEGDGPTSYVMSDESDIAFDDMSCWDRFGKQKFIKNIMECL